MLGVVRPPENSVRLVLAARMTIMIRAAGFDFAVQYKGIIYGLRHLTYGERGGGGHKFNCKACTALCVPSATCSIHVVYVHVHVCTASTARTYTRLRTRRSAADFLHVRNFNGCHRPPDPPLYRERQCCDVTQLQCLRQPPTSKARICISVLHCCPGQWHLSLL